jgi:hypothetical protein
VTPSTSVVLAVCGWPGPRSTLLHLWHPVRTDRSDRADRIFKQTEASDHVEAVVGLREFLAQPDAP